jgi:2-keto-4-pentenoate hydratase/2-oxohepta-3-ene-1,7-dioic acid hydratase in catechol pathway
MRIITFEINRETRWGALKNDYAVDLNLAHALFLASRAREPQYLADSVLEFLERGEAAWNAGRETLEFLGERVVDGVMYPLSRVKLRAPVPRPPKIVAIGQNYMDHVREQNAQVPQYPVLFAKYSSSVVGPYDVIHLHPTEAQKVDYEGELGVVIGKTARNVSAAEALDYVFGYTVANDVSARDLQFSPYVSGQWIRGKSLDTYCPLGPSIVSKDEIADPQNLSVCTWLNGKAVQESNTKEMIFGVARLIEFISRGITLEPGDVISTGTPRGVGHHRTPPVYMQAGDVVQVEIGGIGKLRNEVQD